MAKKGKKQVFVRVEKEKPKAIRIVKNPSRPNK